MLRRCRSRLVLLASLACPQTLPHERRTREGRGGPLPDRLDGFRRVRSRPNGPQILRCSSTPLPVPGRCLAVATMFCVDLLAVVRRKLETMAKDRQDARSGRAIDSAGLTRAPRPSRELSQEQIDPALWEQSSQVQPRPPPCTLPLRPGTCAPYPALGAAPSLCVTRDLSCSPAP